MKRLREALPVVAAALVAILAWRAIVAIGAYPSFILPAPEQVAVAFVRAWLDGTMWRHASQTLLEVAVGFVIGGGVALIVGYALARSRLAAQVLSPYLVAAQSTPILALAPLFALWFGPGLASRVVVCALIVFFPVAVATSVGIRGVDPGLIELARSLRASRRQVFATVEVPAALPQIFGGLRVGATLAVVGAIVSEWASPGEHGLGVLINIARGSGFDIPLMYATLASIALVGIALYTVTVLAERRLVGDRGGRTQEAT